METKTKLSLGMSGLLLSLLGLLACPVDYPAAGSLRFACNAESDCAEGYHCVAGFCEDGVTVLQDAAAVDTNPGDSSATDQVLFDQTPLDVIAPDGGGSDLAVAHDAPATDAAQADALIVDATLADIANDDAALAEDAAVPDVARADAGFTDANATDAGTVDTAIEDVVAADASVHDASSCVDLDDDGFLAYDETLCPSGQDFCDDKRGPHTPVQCNTCVDGDNDNRWVECSDWDQGNILWDCNDEDANEFFSVTLYVDSDGDGLGSNEDSGTIHCTDGTAPQGFSLNHSDCDDSLPTCLSDCSDADGDEVASCVESFCGSDPDEAASTCQVINTMAGFVAAVEAAKDSAGDDFFLLGDFSTGETIEIAGLTDPLIVRQRPGTTVRTSGNTFLKLSANNITLEGLNLKGNASQDKIIEVKGVSNSVKHCTLTTFEKAGIHINTAVGAWIEGNIVTGGTTIGNDRCAIRTQGGSRLTVIGNLLVNNAGHGMCVDGGDTIYIDHNTLANNAGNGILYVSHDAANVCMRNNWVGKNQGAGFAFTNAAIWDDSAACVSPLNQEQGIPIFGNASFGNSTLCDGTCSGDSESDCAACLPSSAIFLADTSDPEFSSLVVGGPGAFCPGASSLIDAAADLGYDRSPDDDSGRWYGAAPDIGARESGSPECSR